MKLLPFLAGILMFLGLEAVFYWPKFFYVFLFLGAVGLIFFLRQIFNPGRKQKPLVNRNFLYFTILGLVFFIGVLFSLLFVKHSILFYVIATTSPILLFGFLHTVQKYFKALKASILNLKEKTETLAENNFSSKIVLFNLASLFFIISSIFGFIIFFRVPFWHLIPLVFLIMVFFTAQVFLTKGDSVSLYDKRVLIMGLLITQFFVILTYLPITFFTAGLFLTIFYGVSLLFIPQFFYECQDKRCRLYQILIGGIILLISLLTLRI